MKIDILDWNKAISSVKMDQSVGIQIAPLTETEGKGTYVTVIPPGAFVNPHYHSAGDEEYHIIQGKGLIRLLPVGANEDEWVSKEVSARHSFIISANVIHQLINTGDEPLTLLFSCPLTHLKDDRFVVANEG